MTHALHKQKMTKLIIYQSKSKQLFTHTLTMVHGLHLLCVWFLQTCIQPKEVSQHFCSANEIVWIPEPLKLRLLRIHSEKWACWQLQPAAVITVSVSTLAQGFLMTHCRQIKGFPITSTLGVEDTLGSAGPLSNLCRALLVSQAVR